MTMTDPIADMLTRVRNANSAGKEKVAMPSSKKLVEIARIMQEEGYVQGYDVIDGEPRATSRSRSSTATRRPRPSAASSASPSRVCASTRAKTSCPACSAALAPLSFRRATA